MFLGLSIGGVVGHEITSGCCSRQLYVATGHTVVSITAVTTIVIIYNECTHIHAKFLQVFNFANFANFQTFGKIISMKCFDT